MPSTSSITRHRGHQGASGWASLAPRRSRPPHRELRFRRPPTGAPSPGDSGGGGRRLRVLVVDDEPAMRTLCRVNLLASGIDVLEAPDGQVALELAVAQQPDLVLLDVMLPGLSGWDVANALAERQETRTIPIVFLSARAEFDDLVRGQEHGAVGYVTKPFDPVAIAGVVVRTVERVARGERELLRAEITGRA